MSNAAAQAYARTAQTTASPREIPGVAESGKQASGHCEQSRPDRRRIRRCAAVQPQLCWAILLSAVTSDDNPQPVEVRQNIVNIGTFVLTQTAELQLNPQRDKLKPLIDINCNLAAGLSGRA